MTKPKTPARHVEVVDVQPTDFERGAQWALALLRETITERCEDIRSAERAAAFDGIGCDVMLNGARELLNSLLSSYEGAFGRGLEMADTRATEVPR